MSVSPPAIEALGLGRDYGETRALDALTLRVDAGALVGLLGPNGAGKTTAMLLLATLLTPSRGTARLFGEDIVRQRRAIRARLGLVFQETSLDGMLTVSENLAFAAGLMGLGGSSARRAVSEAIERTGLLSHASRPVRQLSGGWRRLTDIARATLHRPDLMILDEPTVGLDPEHREKVWSLLDAERRERGVTILFSTHYLTEAESSDRAVLLARGRVVAVADPAARRRTLGDHVLEIEGPGADQAVHALHGLGNVRAVIPTDRGYRIGASGSRDDIARIAGAMSEITRFVMRGVTLEDVYFARTQEARPERPAPPLLPSAR
jgi:ABC-2 type transport system ATP-binding protein